MPNKMQRDLKNQSFFNTFFRRRGLLTRGSFTGRFAPAEPGTELTCDLGSRRYCRHELLTHSGIRARLFALKLALHRQDLLKQVYVNKHNKSSIHFNSENLHNSLLILAHTQWWWKYHNSRAGNTQELEVLNEKSHVTFCCWPRSYVPFIYSYGCILQANQ